MHDTPAVILDFAEGPTAPGRVRFERPEEVVVARSVEEVRPALRRVERAAAGGMYAAGFVAYEAAPAFDSSLVVRPGGELPLLWFGLFDGPAGAGAVAGGEFEVADWEPSVGRGEYARRIGEARELIARGYTYQVNYTLRLRARLRGDDFAFYERLLAAQRSRYGAYVNAGRFRVLSASPELFFERTGNHIRTRPMKGTAGRGRWLEEDEGAAARLASSAKDRAENVMIVDLLRNDLGRVSEFGSVRAGPLYEVERYPTVLQMTSTVEATLKQGTTLEDIFAALFPCGSVTGAPKVSTTRIIAGLEDSPRGVYCGAVGVVAPGGDALFNVGIRTAVVDGALGVVEYGTGGGVTWDSNAADEYAEALNKALLLSEGVPDFELLETMRLEGGRYALLEEHLERLASSATYFDFRLAEADIHAALDAHAAQHPSGARRVRLLVARDGRARVEGGPLDWQHGAAPLGVALARTPVSKLDRFLYHKTTRREVYEARRAEHPEAFDVLLWNEEGELTEFTNGNLVVEIEGRRRTPPRECGLLAGTFRARLLRTGEVSERVLTRSDLRRASACWFVNSVRGWVEVCFR